MRRSGRPRAAADVETPPPARPAAPGQRRIETWLARLGLIGLALLGLAALLVLDIGITPSPHAQHLEPRENQWSFGLVTSDGRTVGGRHREFTLELAPATFYANRPGPGSPPIYRINTWGCRGAEPALGADREVLVLLGGSATFGLFIEESQTFAAHLSKSSERRTVLNGGTVGYLSGQELAQFATRLVSARPRTVIAFDGWNDLYDAVVCYSALGQAPRVRGVNSGFLALEERLVNFRRAQTEPLAAFAQLGGCLARNSSLLAWITRNANPSPRRRPEEFPPDELARVVETYVDNLRRLDHLVRATQGRLIVVLQPEGGQLTDSRLAFPSSAERYPPELYTRFRELALPGLAAAGVEAHDASAYLAEAGTNPRDFDLIDTVHLSVTGHRRMAEWLERLIATEPAARTESAE